MCESHIWRSRIQPGLPTGLFEQAEDLDAPLSLQMKIKMLRMDVCSRFHLSMGRIAEIGPLEALESVDEVKVDEMVRRCYAGAQIYSVLCPF